MTAHQRRVNHPLQICVALFLLFAICILSSLGCKKNQNAESNDKQAVPEKLDVTDAEPRLDMMKLQYDFAEGEVVTHNQTLLSFKTDNWTIRIEPIEGSLASMYHTSRMQTLSDYGAPADTVEDPSKKLVVYRYHLPSNVTKKTFIGQYLINIDDHWFSGRIIPANPELAYDQESASRFLLSLKLNAKNVND